MGRSPSRRGMRLLVLVVALVASVTSLWIDDAHEARVPPPPLAAKKLVLSIPSEGVQTAEAASNTTSNTTSTAEQPMAVSTSAISDITVFPYAKGFPPKLFLVCVVTAPD